MLVQEATWDHSVQPQRNIWHLACLSGIRFSNSLISWQFYPFRKTSWLSNRASNLSTKTLGADASSRPHYVPIFLPVLIFFFFKWLFIYLFNPQRADSLEKTLMLGNIEGRRRRGQQRVRLLDNITDSMVMSLSKLGNSEGQGNLVGYGPCCSRVRHNWACTHALGHCQESL